MGRLSELSIPPPSGASGGVSVLSLGAIGDGAANDTAALAAAFAAGGTIYVPDGTYIFDTTIEVLEGTKVVFESRDAILKYTGTGTALRITQQKNIEFESGTLDLSASADASVVGLHGRGVWFFKWDSPRIIQGPATSTGFLFEPNNYGAYIIQIVSPDMFTGAGSYGIRTQPTAADTRSTTHLAVFGGWIKNKTVGIRYEKAMTGRVIGTAVESATDGIQVKDSTDIHLAPGEIGTCSGYGINLDTGNAAIALVTPSGVGIASCTLGYVNTTNHKPVRYTTDVVHVRGSRTDETYYATLKSIFTYAKSFVLAVRGGGGSEDEILTFGDGVGLTIKGPAGFGKLVKIDGPLQLDLSNARLRSGAGDPQGTLAGTQGDIYFRTGTPTVANQRIYICTVTGANAAATTWVGIV